MNITLTNKRAIVCGSTQGIGLAVARELAALGASVTLVARDSKALDAAITSLAVFSGQRHEKVVADFNRPEDLKQAIKDYLKNGENINILINNTGGPAGGPVVDSLTEQFENTFRQHLICNHILVQETLPSMKSSGYGRIINIISTSVKQPLKGLGVSNTVRAAVAGWAKTLAAELAPFGITVNNVLPGATSTGRLSSLISAKSQKTGRAEKDLEMEMISEIPMGRFASPEEIANAVAFFASPAASYITGTSLPVDGGRTSCY